MRKRDKLKEESELMLYSIGVGVIIGIIFMSFIIHIHFTKKSLLINSGQAEYSKTTGEFVILSRKED